jgi:hypothetical protein
MLLGLVLLVAGCGGGKGGSTTQAVHPSVGKLTVVLKGGGPSPKANANWPYTVTATNPSGKRVSGKITVEIVDPVGNAHAVTYRNTKRPVKGFPFHGKFHDSLTFPRESIGFPLIVRAKVTSSEGSGTANYSVTPK